TDAENTGVRLVWKDLPRSDAARLPARAARAAGAQQKFWDMTDRLMGESKGTADQAALLDHAQALGLDVNKFREALASPAIDAALDADVAQAHRFGIFRAPAIFINGKFVKDPLSASSLRERMTEARAFASDLVATGTPRERIYTAIMRGALQDTGPIT